MKYRDVQVRAGLMAAVFAAMAWGFQAMLLDHAPHAFNSPEEDMSFAWYVPLFSLYVLWTERRRIAASVGAPSVWGAVAALPFLALGFLGARGVQLRLEIVAFVGLALASVWAVFGRRTAQAVLFPALFLLFCIPLATFLDVVTVHLRLLACSTAYAVLQGVGAEVVRQGTMLGAADGSFSIDVAEPCSGLRSIFALMALTAAYAYFNQPTWLRRALLFASSVPLAILGNVMRILTICLVANYCSKDFATGFYHDYSGYVVFIVAILLMVAVGELITRAAGGRGAAEEGAAAAAAAEPASRGGRVLAAVFTAAVVAAMVVQAMTPQVTLAEAPEVRFADVEGYECQPMSAGEAELKVLPADTRIERRLYTAADGSWFQATAIVGGASKSSIHRPELCLPAQGYQMSAPRTVRVGGTDWRFITLRSGGAPETGFAYTFVNQEGFRTASHVGRILRDVWDRSVLNRIDRWVMITVGCSSADDAALSRAVSRLEGVVR